MLVGQPQFAADLVAGTAGDGLELLGLAAQEKGRVAFAQTQLHPDRLGLVMPQRLGDGTGGLGRAILGLAPEDIAHARQALRLGECVHAVGEFARAAGRRGNGAHLGAVLFQQLRENREARAAEMVGHHLHLDRVAQVGLVAAVFQHRLGIGDARPVGIDRAAIAEFLEQALDDRLDGLEDVLLFDKDISRSSW